MLIPYLCQKLTESSLRSSKECITQFALNLKLPEFAT
ncbi:hypothetical protein CLV25_10239 [Acetobacteroides hydrogenigenes]|uniref:Uncharacterized protein n=1 Tax=Acetobacteroides hydrogenigenes TaxID=979970 RepID=A0A4R2ES75_9BACT|nr:hypothetical protein CLV25_10239 [Acetobacteroides hydrogenigenes]